MKTDLYAWATARCAKQEFSRADICSKLMGKGASAEEARTLTERLVDECYVDDARFAAAFVADKIRFDHWGRIKIRYMLHLKGVADDLVEEALEQIDETAYTETLKQFLNSRLRSAQAATPFALRQKVARTAIGRGFEPSLVFRLLNMEE